MGKYMLYEEIGIRVERLRWLGHIIKIEEGRIERKGIFVRKEWKKLGYNGKRWSRGMQYWIS